MSSMLPNFFATLSLLFGFVAISSFTAHASVYFMILSFLSTGILYYLLSSTYISMMLFIVYVGAVAILFVFCVILLSLQSIGNVNYLQYFAYTFVLIFFTLNVYKVMAREYEFYVDFFEFAFADFNFSYFSKDTTFLSTFYTIFTPCIIFLGVLLFFVTVAVTVLIGLSF